MPPNKNWIDEIIKDLKLRLEKHKVVIGECWLYKGRKGRQWIGINYKTYLIHRVSAVVYLGFDIDSWDLICHKRECPNPGCYNPEHLYIGDSSTNKLDEVALGNYKNQNTNKENCGVCGEPYDGIIYKSRGRIWRYCKQCKYKNKRSSDVKN
jgi:hypothetical protein